MRYLSLYLPFLATDRIRRRLVTNMPRELVCDEAAPVVTLAKIKNAFRLVALDALARSLGLRPGIALADARAMHPMLAVHDADPDGDIAARDAIVDWCRLFTPLAASDGANGVMLDITGAAHLFGGESALMKTLARRLQAQGFASEVAIASAPAAAWALARFGGTSRHLEKDLGPDDYATFFAPMPLAALRLDTETITQLGQAGLRHVGDLLMRPRAPIAARFGGQIHHRLNCLLGHARDPISPRFEAPPYLAERRFSDGIARHEDVDATILALAHDLCDLLLRHGEGARRLDAALYRVDGAVKHVEIGTSRPLRDPHTIRQLFRERIAAENEEGLDTGYGFDVIRLAACAVERLDAVQPGWITTKSDENALAGLIDRLGARFGFECVTRLVAADTCQPEHATTEACANIQTKRRPPPIPTARDDIKALPERPIRLLDPPEPIEAIAEVPDWPPARFFWRRVTHHVAAIEGPERISPEWWRTDQDDVTRTRDYFRAEDTEGRRFWIYREGFCHASTSQRWFLHGLFA